MVEIAGETVSEVLSHLVTEYPALATHLFDDKGTLRKFVNLFANGQDIRMMNGLETNLANDDELQIVPAIAGGASAIRDFLTWQSELLARIAETDPQTLSESEAGETSLLDVRGADEWKQGHIPGAIHLDRGFLEMKIEQAQPDRSARIVCYCQSGSRSLFAAQTLAAMGYVNVASLAGGFQRWKTEGRPIIQPAFLTESEAIRYQRQMSIPEVGIAGQCRLAASRVLVVGLGGLGCPVSLYLAAAGVGAMGLVDDDVVDLSNLHRQILYGDAMMGVSKVEAARKVLTERNPSLKTTLYRERLDPERARELFDHYDVIVDGTDNFRSRYCINDVAAAFDKPVVHGAVYRFTGQVGVFWASKGPCYRCLYCQPPPPELAPSCAEGGVLGVLPGTVGLIMATETLKILLGIGELPVGRLLTYDGLGGRFMTLSFGKDAACEACGSTAALAGGAPGAMSAAHL